MGETKKAFEFYGEDNQENLEKSEKQIKYKIFKNKIIFL